MYLGVFDSTWDGFFLLFLSLYGADSEQADGVIQTGLAADIHKKTAQRTDMQTIPGVERETKTDPGKVTEQELEREKEVRCDFVRF